MRVVIATDKFKGSLSSSAVAHHLTIGLGRTDDTLAIDVVAVADGGEGTLDAAVMAGFSRHTIKVTGPTGLAMDAAFAARGQEAIVEMATASGLAVLPGGVLDAMGATSEGTGELIRAALDLGCTSIVLALGGSACTDGGAGMLVGLGAELLDDEDRPLPRGGGALARAARIDLRGLDPLLKGARIVLASDVDNGLLGPLGAAAVFAAQKGATPDEVRMLDAALSRFVAVLGAERGERALAAAAEKGAGAAGGVGYAALAVLGAHRESGFEVVEQLSGLAGRIAGADLVITGEGSLDEQSLAGKTPFGVARTAARAGVPVVAVCGRTTLDAHQLTDAGFVRTFSLNELEPRLHRCMADAGALLERIGTAIGSQLALLQR